jgi:hypothetical protein
MDFIRLKNTNIFGKISDWEVQCLNPVTTTNPEAGLVRYENIHTSNVPTSIHLSIHYSLKLEISVTWRRKVWGFNY